MLRKLASIIAIAICALAVAAPARAQVPPPVPALPDTERRTSYSITAATGPFDVGFAVYGDGIDYSNWIEVWLNGVRLTPVTQWTLGLSSGSLTTSARPLTNARVTLLTAGTGTLQIVGARRSRRAAQFAENRGVAARDFNQALTDIISQNRETWDKINDVSGRIVQAPPGETLTVLPPLATRASGYFIFDGNGNPSIAPIPLVGTGNVNGPVGSLNNELAVFSGATGKLLTNGTNVAPTIPIIAPSSVGAPSATGSGCNLTATAGPVLHQIPYTDQNWCTLFNLWSMSNIEPSALALWTVGGTITAGDVITMGFVQVKQPDPNVIATITYTVQGGDTTATIAQGLVAAIKANPTLYTLPSGGYQSGAIFSYVPWLGNPQYPGGLSDSQFALDYDAKYTLTWDYAVTGGNTETLTSKGGWYTGAIYYGGTTAGAVNAQTITVAGFADGAGISVQFKAGLTNTAAMTLNVNGIGAIAVQKYNNAGAIVNVVAGDVTTGSTYVVNRSQVVNSWILGLNSTPLPAYSTKGPLAILPNSWDATFIVQPSRVTGTTSVAPQVSGAAPPGSPLWLLSPACETTDSTGVLYGATGCGQFGPVSMGLSHGNQKYAWMIQTAGSIWMVGDGIFAQNGCNYLFEPACGLQDKGAGTINANGFYAGNLAGLSRVLNLRAAGGAVDCTATVTGGLITATTCP